MISGTNKNPRYHPGYSRERITHRAQTSPIPVTEESGSHYSRAAFTRPTRESDRQNLPHRLAPTAGSLEHPVKASFPSLSFLIFCCSHLTTNSRFCQLKAAKKRHFVQLHKNEKVKWKIFGRKTFDFSSWTCYNVTVNILKAVTKTVRQTDFQRVGVWCEPTACCHKTHHFRAGVSSECQALPSARVKG